MNKGAPRMYIVSGCNGSGKTTASYTILPEFFNCRQFVNSDEFAKGLSPFDPNSASVSASRYMLMKIRYLLNRNEDLAIETTLATRSLKKIILDAQKKGYFVTVMYFWLAHPDIAVERVKKRVENGGHNVPEPVIRRRYDLGLKYLFKDYMPIADSWILADNTEVPFTIIAQGWKENMVVKENNKFEKIRQYALSRDDDAELEEK